MVDGRVGRFSRVSFPGAVYNLSLVQRWEFSSLTGSRGSYSCILRFLIILLNKYPCSRVKASQMIFVFESCSYSEPHVSSSIIFFGVRNYITQFIKSLNVFWVFFLPSSCNEFNAPLLTAKSEQNDFVLRKPKRKKWRSPVKCFSKNLNGPT